MARHTLKAACLLTLLAACGPSRDDLLRDLNGPRPELRATALRRLAELRHPDDFVLFLQRAHDSSPWVRLAVVEIFWDRDEPRAVDALGEALSDPDLNVARAAAKGLSKNNGEKARAYLLGLYATRGTEVRRSIAQALGGPEGFAEAVLREARWRWEHALKALDEGTGAERVAAAEEMGRSGRPEAVDRLLPLLGDDSVLLAAGAARGLGASRDLRAEQTLLGPLKDAFPQLREAAAEALGLLGSSQAAVALGQAALSGGTAAEAALRALERLPAGQEKHGALCSVAVSGAETLAEIAARSAREQGGCEIQPVLEHLAKGGAEARAAIPVLAALGDEKAAAKLVPLASSGDFALRLTAIRALASLGASPARDALSKIVRSESARIAAARERWVKEALPTKFAEGFLPEKVSAEKGKLNQLMDRVREVTRAKAGKVAEAVPEVPSELVDDLPQGDGALLGAAAFALGSLGGDHARELVAPLVADSDDAVRAGALAGLARCQDEALRQKGAEGLRDRSEEVARSVEQALESHGEAVAPLLLRNFPASGAARQLATRALGRWKHKQAVGELVEQVKAGGLEALDAIEALGRIGDASAVPALVAHLASASPLGREEALWALGELGEPSAADTVERELYSDRAPVRAAAIRALQRLGTGKALGYLQALRGDYDVNVRQAADQALGKGGAASSARTP